MSIALPERPYPLHWPVDWTRTAAGSRSHERYRASLFETRELIEEELRMLVTGRKHVPVRLVMSSDIPTRRDGIPYANYDPPLDPGAAVWWIDNAGKTCVVACDAWTSVEGNFRAIALNLKALRAMQRTRTTQILQRSLENFRTPALPADATPSSKPWWAEKLGVELPASRDAVMAAYRNLVKATHPDRGGDATEFDMLTVARDEALRLVG